MTARISVELLLFECIRELSYVQSVENCNSGLCATSLGEDLIERGMKALGVKDLSDQALESLQAERDAAAPQTSEVKVSEPLCGECGKKKGNPGFHLDALGDNWGAALHWFRPAQPIASNPSAAPPARSREEAESAALTRAVGRLLAMAEIEADDQCEMTLRAAAADIALLKADAEGK